MLLIELKANFQKNTMFMRFTHLVALSSIVAVSSLVASDAIAQTVMPNFELIELESIPEAFDNAFTEKSGDSFERNALPGTFKSIFGLPVFPEDAIARDAEDVDKLYRQILFEQVASDPILRTPDLRNPFNTTLLSNPAMLGSQPPIPGGEFVFEVQPLR